MTDMKELRIGDNLQVILIGGETKYYQITGTDDIFYKDTHSALASGATEAYTAVGSGALNPPVNQIYCITNIETESNVQIYLKQPAATNRWGTNNSPAGGLLNIDQTQIMAGRPISLWFMQNYDPNVQLVNNTNVSITPVLWWIGKRYTIKDIPKPSVYTIAKIGGLSQ